MIKNTVRRWMSKPGLLSLVGRRQFVFCYHDVSESNAAAHSPLYSTEPLLFKQHIEALSKAFDWVSVDGLNSTHKKAKPQAALTFDDGFLSVKDFAIPFLRTSGIPSALFVCKTAATKNFLPVTTRHLIARHPDWSTTFGNLLHKSDEGYGFIQPSLDEILIKRFPEIEAAGVLREKIYLSPQEIVDLNGPDVTIGSHSTSHRVLASLETLDLQADIAENAEFLTELGVESGHFAIPFGKKEHYSPSVIDVLHSQGYDAIYTTNPRDFVATDGTHRLVPRICVTNQTVDELTFSVVRTLLQKIDL